MTLKKEGIYNKYKSETQATFVFYYLLEEYHCQPDEFLYYSSPYKTAEQILDESTKCAKKEDSKRIIDDFFCDIHGHKKGMNSVSWL